MGETSFMLTTGSPLFSLRMNDRGFLLRPGLGLRAGATAQNFTGASRRESEGLGILATGGCATFTDVRQVAYRVLAAAVLWGASL